MKHWVRQELTTGIKITRYMIYEERDFFLYSLEITLITSEFHNLGRWSNLTTQMLESTECWTHNKYQVHLKFFKLNFLSSRFKI